MCTSTMNYNQKSFVLGNYLPTENTPVVDSRYAIKNVNPSFYSYIHVDKEKLILNTGITSNIYLSYVTSGNFNDLLNALKTLNQYANETFIHNLTCVFNYLRDKNINTDEFQVCDGVDMSIVIVAVVLVASFKCPDCLIKNGKKFYDYVVGYINSHKEYYSMVTLKVQSHPISVFDVLVQPLCDEVVEILKKGE